MKQTFNLKVNVLLCFQIRLLNKVDRDYNLMVKMSFERQHGQNKQLKN